MFPFGLLVEKGSPSVELLCVHCKKLRIFAYIIIAPSIINAIEIMRKVTLLLITLFLTTVHSIGQYTFTTNIQGQTGIDVDITLNFNTVVTGSQNCANGYVYQIQFDYDVIYNQLGNGNGNNTLNTLQGALACGSNESFFNLPTNGGQGTNLTANKWSNSTNCSTVTVEDLMCSTIDLTVQGPGINYQTIRLEAVSSLPVQLINFDSKKLNNNHVELNWTTASEQNNDYFTIEKSRNGEHWTTFETVEGVGTTSETTSYTIDDQLVSGLTYYRLIQTDFDGTTKKLKTIAVDAKETEQLTVYPNPAVETINVKGVKNPESLQLVNAMGADQTGNITMNPSSHGIQLDISNLRRGIYFIIANGEKMRIIKR